MSASIHHLLGNNFPAAENPVYDPGPSRLFQRYAAEANFLHMGSNQNRLGTKIYSFNAGHTGKGEIMKKLGIIVALLSFAMLIGCAGPYTGGWILSQYNAPACSPDEAGGLDIGARVGKATMINYLGLIAQGDASITAAAKNGKISKVKTVDYNYDSLLGIINKTTTIVTGD